MSRMVDTIEISAMVVGWGKVLSLSDKRTDGRVRTHACVCAFSLCHSRSIFPQTDNDVLGFRVLARFFRDLEADMKWQES